MKSLFHGKHYYIEVRPSKLKDKIFEFIKTQDELKDEEFMLYYSNPSNTWVIWSKAMCGSFRGEKYSAWERVKRYAYKLKKEDSPG